MNQKVFFFCGVLVLALVSFTSCGSQFFLPLFPAAYLPHVVGTGAGLGAVALLKLKSVAAAKAFVYLRDQGVLDKLKDLTVDLTFDKEEAGWDAAVADSHKSGSEAMETIVQYEKMDCGLRMMCELSVKKEEEMTEEEKILMTLYGSEDKLKAVEADSTEKFSYVNAAELGKATKDPLVCASVFHTCPHDAKAVMEVLKKAAAAAP